MQKVRILIVEDEAPILIPLVENLRYEGYQVESVSNGATGLSKALENEYDLIILDIVLPDMDGFEICKRIREVDAFTPIVMLTARTQEFEKIYGLRSGADDYVTKPFSPRELMARIEALLRRSRQGNGKAASEILQFGDVEINFNACEARKAGLPVSLTALQFALIRFFAKHPRDAVKRDNILDEVWGKDIFVTPRTVDTHIKQLRKKLEDDPANPHHFLTVHGIGYKFIPDGELNH